MKLKKITALLLSAAMMAGMLTACSSGGGGDKKYPSKDITVIIPKNPGGGTEIGRAHV